ELSIVRPGPITGNMVHPYLKRRNGEEDTVYPHESLKPVLEKTYGVPLFQEQAMRVAMVAADYTPGEADQLRRDMAAWRTTGKIERHRKRLIERMVEKGIAREFAERVYKQIQGFGSYGFPESHAAGFALIAYATAYLKCHYPAAFACALLNAWPMGFYAPATIVDDAKRHGVTVLPVTVLRSDWDCALERDPQRPQRLAVRLGLRYIQGLGVCDWETIRAARVHCREDFRAFLDTARLDRDILVQLALAGAYRCFGVSRRDALFAVLGADAHRAASLAIDDEERTPHFSHLSSFEVVAWDHETSGASTFGHPLAPYRRELSDLGLPDARHLADRQHGDVSSYVGMVICRQMPSTAGGVVFMTLEDESGFVNLIIWKRIFEQYRTLILTNEIIGITGTVQKEGAVVHLVAERFWLPTLSGRAAHRSSRDFH
ncbi:MAG: OB-fold nucleic acid binding domain-containing protein, partial [Spirochaetales bacterium]|nr:OB-fold nucleic acid binding domain-containing protein [Spirochaetales bacterium]